MQGVIEMFDVTRGTNDERARLMQSKINIYSSLVAKGAPGQGKTLLNSAVKANNPPGPSWRWERLGRPVVLLFPPAKAREIRNKPNRFVDLPDTLRGFKPLPVLMTELDTPGFEFQNLARFAGSAAQYVLYDYLYDRVVVRTPESLKEADTFHDYAAQVIPIHHVKFLAQNVYAALLELWRRTVTGPVSVRLPAPPAFPFRCAMSPAGFTLPWLAFRKRNDPDTVQNYHSPALFPDLVVLYNGSLRVVEMKTSTTKQDNVLKAMQDTAAHCRQCILQGVAVWACTTAAGVMTPVYADLSRCQMQSKPSATPWRALCEARSVRVTYLVAREAMFWALQEMVMLRQKQDGANPLNQQDQLFVGLFTDAGGLKWSYSERANWLNKVLISLRDGVRHPDVDDVPLLKFLVPGDPATPAQSDKLNTDLGTFDPTKRPKVFWRTL